MQTQNTRQLNNLKNMLSYYSLLNWYLKHFTMNKWQRKKKKNKKNTQKTHQPLLYITETFALWPLSHLGQEQRWCYSAASRAVSTPASSWKRVKNAHKAPLQRQYSHTAPLISSAFNTQDAACRSFSPSCKRTAPLWKTAAAVSGLFAGAIF